MKTITITCENTGRDYHVAPGTTVGELQQIIHPENRYPVMGALVNNQLQDLQYVIMAPSRINYVDMTSLDGYSVNTRSLIFVLYKAVTQLYPRRLLRVEYFLSNGIYCRISHPDTKLTAEIIDRLREEMRQIIAADYPITRENIPTEKVVQLFRKKGLKDKTDLLETRGKRVLLALLHRQTAGLFLRHFMPLHRMPANLRADSLQGRHAVAVARPPTTPPSCARLSGRTSCSKCSTSTRNGRKSSKFPTSAASTN